MQMENIEKKYYKLKLCKFYEKSGKCTKGDKCNYAHGKNEIREIKKDNCINGEKCFKKYCKFNHPEGWNYKNNIKICEFFKNGYCINEDNCKFKHINEIEKNNSDSVYTEIKENIDINDDNDFPSLNEIENSNIIKINKGLINEISFNSIENMNLKNDIQYHEINKDENISISKFNSSSPNIDIFVDGIEYNDKDKNNNMLNINENTNNIEIENLINNLQNDFMNFSGKIKNNIDEVFTEDKHNYGINMKLELNKIISEINLFKNNYKDIIRKIN